MHSTFAPITNTPGLMLATSPAQTCIAHGANFKYGKQGLPDLPLRLRPLTKTRKRSSAKKTRATTTGSSKGRSATTASSQVDQDDKVMMIPYRPYEHNVEDEEDDTVTKELLIPVTLSLSSNCSRSTTSSSSSTAITTTTNTSHNKKVGVIKKKLKRHTRKTKRSSTSLAAVQEEEEEPLHLDHQDHSLPSRSNNKGLAGGKGRNRGKVGVYEGEDEDYDAHNENSEDDENGDDDEKMRLMMSGSISSRLATTDKVRSSALPLLKQRLGFLWENKLFTDVVFLVGQNSRNIETHRVILASCSEVFESLLYGEGKPLMSADGKHILYENDFSESAFEVFIKAMYTNEIPICLTLAMALEVFYATKKYAVLFLEDQVLEHIRQLLTISNVFEAMRFSMNAVELTYLTPICWRIVEENTAEVLDYHLDSLDAHLFARILERDRLSAEEAELFQLGVRWAANMCKIHGMKTTGKNKRHFLEPLLKHFRFTTMSSTQFNEMVAPARILDQKEVKQIQCAFHKAVDLKNLNLPYNTTPRVHTASESRGGSAKIIFNNNNNRRTSSRTNMDGSGDFGNGGGQPVQIIYSDSAMLAPGLGSKVHSTSNKKGMSSPKLKMKRVPSSSNHHPTKPR